MGATLNAARIAAGRHSGASGSTRTIRAVPVDWPLQLSAGEFASESFRTMSRAAMAINEILGRRDDLNRCGRRRETRRDRRWR
jgi:hypothetical protein